jgi:hypothetical protein
VDWYPGRTAPRRRSSASFRANINGRSARSEVEAFGAGIDGLGRQLLHESGAVAPRRAGNRPPFRPNTTGADIRRFWRATERGHGARPRSAGRGAEWDRDNVRGPAARWRRGLVGPVLASEHRPGRREQPARVVRRQERSRTPRHATRLACI